MKRFARLPLGFSKKLENLAAAIGMHMANYNSSRPAKKATAVDCLTRQLWQLG